MKTRIISIEENKLKSFGEDGSYFHEHPPKPGYIPGVEAATGSLGHGFSMGIGMATAAKIQGDDYRVYCLLGDGECNEGTNWEAAMFAAGQNVDHVTAIIDYNKWQATGRSQEVMALEPLADKWEAFGWHAQQIDGHDFEAINKALDKARSETEKPSVIVADTIKGKGVSFMEDDNNWHYRTPNTEELAAALTELQEILLQISSRAFTQIMQRCDRAVLIKVGHGPPPLLLAQLAPQFPRPSQPVQSCH